MGVIEKQSIQDIANAIRNRNGLTTLYKPREMDEAILNLYSTTKVNSMLDYILPCHEEEATDFTIKYADSDRPCSISELEGNTTQNGTPTPTSPVEIKTVSGDNNIVVSNEQHVTGNSYRVDLGGKNLLNNTATTQTINGVTFTVNEDKSVNVNGTASGNAILILNSFTFEENKSYRLSGCPSGGTGSTYKLDAFGSSGLSSDIGTGVTINVAGTRNVRIVIFSGITVNNLTFYPQIELGTVATEYSPYVSNPIELCKIGNYVDSIKKSTGNNKADTENATVLNGYFDGSHTTVTSASTNRTTYFKVQPNTTYTVSKLQSIRSFIGVTQTLPDIGTSITQIKNIGSSTFDGRTRVSGTITTGSNDNYIVVNYANVNTDTGTQADTIKNSIMLNEGETAQPYEPYGNNWYIEKNIGKVVLNGTRTWTSSSTYTGYARFNCDALPEIVTNNNGLNTHFTQRVSQAHGGYDYLYISPNTKKIYVQIQNSIVSSVSAFTTWLSNNNVTVYYIKPSPEYEIITNENLLEQLNNLKNIELIENLCYVDWVGVEKPKMKLFCYLDKDKIIEEITG